MDEIDRAEFIQAVNAYLIPTSLFIACLIGAAGTFLLYNSEPLGWAFIIASAAIIIWAFVTFIRFQNKLRARGQFKDEPNE
ncbi:MAG: hypothetical protein K2W82_02810 [Candidatus Obscuribacterales bacterium]|jgi:hypothetical protein|nr:hypothetical protein [Candidatus Obscuribacterales bacterium]